MDESVLPVHGDRSYPHRQPRVNKIFTRHFLRLLLFFILLVLGVYFLFLQERIPARKGDGPSPPIHPESFKPWMPLHVDQKFYLSNSFLSLGSFRNATVLWLPFSKLQDQDFVRAVSSALPALDTPKLELPNLYKIRPSTNDYTIESFFYSTFDALVKGVIRTQICYKGSIPNLDYTAMLSSGYDGLSYLKGKIGNSGIEFYPVVHVRIEFPLMHFGVPDADRTFINSTSLIHLYNKDFNHINDICDHFLVQGGLVGSHVDIFLEMDPAMPTHSTDPDFYFKSAECLGVQLRYILDNLEEDGFSKHIPINPLCMPYLASNGPRVCFPSSTKTVSVCGSASTSSLTDTTSIDQWRELFRNFKKNSLEKHTIYRLEIETLESVFRALSRPEQVFLAFSSSFRDSLLQLMPSVKNFLSPSDLYDYLTTATLPITPEFSMHVKAAMNEIHFELSKLFESTNLPDHIESQAFSGVEYFDASIHALPYRGMLKEHNAVLAITHRRNTQDAYEVKAIPVSSHLIPNHFDFSLYPYAQPSLSDVIQNDYTYVWQDNAFLFNVDSKISNGRGHTNELPSGYYLRPNTPPNVSPIPGLDWSIYELKESARISPVFLLNYLNATKVEQRHLPSNISNFQDIALQLSICDDAIKALHAYQNDLCTAEQFDDACILKIKDFEFHHSVDDQALLFQSSRLNNFAECSLEPFRNIIDNDRLVKATGAYHSILISSDVDNKHPSIRLDYAGQQLLGLRVQRLNAADNLTIRRKLDLTDNSDDAHLYFLYYISLVST